MKPLPKQHTNNGLLCAAADGTLPRKLKKYLRQCRPAPDADPKHDMGRFPNPAGFCSMLECGTDSIEELRTQYPAQYAYLCAVFEDEALNSTRSPTIVNAYLKEKFGYGAHTENGENTDGTVRLVFEHDITEDGA